MTPAEELRAAAQRLRDLAEAATPGPWAWEATGQQDNSWGLGVVVDEDENDLSGDITDIDGAEVVEPVCTGDDNLPNAAYIAAMHPGVALALAELLDEYAGQVLADFKIGLTDVERVYAREFALARLVLEVKP